MYENVPTQSARLVQIKVWNLAKSLAVIRSEFQELDVQTEMVHQCKSESYYQTKPKLVQTEWNIFLSLNKLQAAVTVKRAIQIAKECNFVNVRESWLQGEHGEATEKKRNTTTTHSDTVVHITTRNRKIHESN